MASDLQRKKTSLVFTAMDVDGDGFLERDDFDALTDRWLGIRGEVGEERLRTTMMGWWQALRTHSDGDDDRRITLDEVLALVDTLDDIREVVVETAESMFEAVDEDGDGRVSAPEYARMIHAWTGDESPTGAAFARLDLDGDGSISKAEFIHHWVEFWVGDDADAPGTHLFGEV